MDRLVEQVDKLREAIALYDAQLTAQSEETRAAKEALMEARMEIEVVNSSLNFTVFKFYAVKLSCCYC